MILSLGDFQQDYSWIWKPDGVEMNGMQKRDLTHCTYLTTTFKPRRGNKLRVYCNGILLGSKSLHLSIDSPKLSIGTHEDKESTQEDFAGCISKVVILSYRATKEEVSKGYQHNPPGFLKNCHWEETKDDYLADTAAYIGWTCASNEILTGFELQASEDDVTKVRCCELGGHSSVVPDSCIFTDLADPEFFQPEHASCHANEHMVFNGAYDKREEAGDAYTEIKVGKCCEVECDTPWCAGKDWGVNTEECYTISKDPYNHGVQELVCPKGTLMTQIHDGHQGEAHGIQRVESVVCCALDLIAKPSKAPTKRPTDSPSPSPTTAPSPSPTDAPSASPTKRPTDSPSPSPTTAPSPSPTDAPSAAPTTKVDCLLALRCSTDMNDADWLAAIEKCCGNTAYYRRALKGRLLPEEAERM